jgi:Fe-S oxidoreductase
LTKFVFVPQLITLKPKPSLSRIGLVFLSRQGVEKMALEDYRSDMETCCRCSACKFIPLEKVKGYQPVNICPSISWHNFHAYSGGGRMGIGVALLEKRLDYTEKLLEVVYDCMTCGGCDISCKYAMDMEVLKPIYETRIKCVESGHTLPVLERIIIGLRNKGTMVVGEKVKRDDWSEGLDVKDSTVQKTDVIYHAGCRTCFDKDMWRVARATVNLLQKAGVDVGIAGENESCCGGRAYQMGYKEDAIKQAERNMELFKKTGARTLVTGCSDCYHAFKVLYDEFGLKGDLEVLHTTEYIDKLIKEGKLKPNQALSMNVTYHDPCHLGRLGEPYISWQGKQVPGHIRIFDPPKEFRRGTYGIYEPPRDILKSIPGLKLVEMERIKEYAWCCGAGGGVTESNPEFARFAAEERIKEAESTGAGAIVTACPGCEKSFSEAIKETGSTLKVYDIVDIVDMTTM